jgi:hypothetical protein
VSGQIVPQIRGSLDPDSRSIANSSVWLRSAAGVAKGIATTRSPFLFRRIRQQYVDDKSIKRVEIRPFPGFDIDQLSGLSFVRRWRMESSPSSSNRGTPSLYVNWLRPRYSSPAWGPLNSSLRKQYASVGGQMDLHISVLHWYDMTLSAGYAVGYQGRSRAGS